MQNIVDGRSLEERLPSPDQFTLAVVMSIGFVITSVWVLWDSFFPSPAQENNNNTNTANQNSNNTEQPAAGTRNDPVIINDDDEYESVLIHLWNRVLAVIRNPSPIHLVLALGFIVPLTILAPLLLDGFQDEYGLTGVVHRQFGTPGVLQMAVLAIVAHSLTDKLEFGNNEIIYAHRLKLLAKFGLGNEAEELLEQMKDHKLSPSIIHYTEQRTYSRLWMISLLRHLVIG